MTAITTPASRRGGPRLREALAEALWLTAALRLLLGALALYVVASASVPGPCHFELARNGWTAIPRLEAEGPSFALVGVWQRWDACWYTKIATFGYEAGTDAVAFFPLFPALTGLAGRLVGGSMALGGLLVSTISLVAALTALFLLVGRDIGRAEARRAVLYMAVFPAAFFFIAPFTESLFLACAAGSMLAARSGRPWLAAFAGFLAGLTRSAGAFLALPLAWEMIRAYLAWRARSTNDRSAARRLWPAALAAVAPIAGFATYVLGAQSMTGSDPIEVQAAWGSRSFFPPWEVVAASWEWAVARGDPLQLLNLGLLLGFIVVTVVAVRHVPLSYTLYALPQLAILVTRIQPTPLTSTTRYLAVVFPVFVALAIAGRDRRFDRTLLVGSALGLALLTISFLHGDFVA